VLRSVALSATISLFSLSAAGVGAPFNERIRIGEELGSLRGVSVTIASSGQPAVVFSAGDRIYLAHGLDAFSSPRPIGAEDEPSVVQDSPAAETDTVGVTYVAFREKDGSDLKGVKWTSNPGGQFKPPSLIPDSAHQGVEQPAIAILPTGEVFIGWTASESPGDGRVFVSVNGGAPIPILSGTEASFAVGGDGVVHTVYVRDGDVYYSFDGDGDFGDGSFVENEVRVTESSRREFRPRIAVSTEGTPYVCYMAEEGDGVSLYLTGEDWSAVRLLSDDVGPCACASLKALGSGYVAAFVQGAVLYRESGISLAFSSRPQPVLDLPENVEFFEFALDEEVNMHVVYVEEGRLYYTNDAPPPVADFAAEPTEGEYPLEVHFEDRSEGHVLQYKWDFGDGSTSLLSDPVHVYNEAGTFTVTLRVVGTGGAADQIVKEDFVAALPKRNHLYVPDVVVYAGQQGVKIPVKATNDSPIQGFQLAGRYDKEKLDLGPGDSFIDFEFTTVDALDPEFVAASKDPEAGVFTLGVIFDAAPPIVGKSVPARQRVNLVNLMVKIFSAVPNRSEAFIRLENGIGDPPISNIFTVNGGISVYPELHNGTITIIRPDMEYLGPFFLRGDANNDGAISIADCIFVLGYLFAGRDSPYCLDSADVDDNQMVNIADAIAILSYLFGNKFSPAYPFPTPGLDPTPDDLPGCGEN